MKSLKTIQTLSKIARIISKIVFIFCCVGFGGCLVGAAGTAVGVQALKFGGVSLESIIQKNAEMSVGALYAVMILGAIFCAGEAVMAKFSELYFKRELADGTPFTMRGAKEMQKLGIIVVCISVGGSIVSGIAYAVLEAIFSGEIKHDWTFGGSVMIGVAFIVVAQILKYGAELFEARSAQPAPGGEE